MAKPKLPPHEQEVVERLRSDKELLAAVASLNQICAQEDGAKEALQHPSRVRVRRAYRENARVLSKPKFIDAIGLQKGAAAVFNQHERGAASKSVGAVSVDREVWAAFEQGDADALAETMARKLGPAYVTLWHKVKASS